jgi:hypothetical protein
MFSGMAEPGVDVQQELLREARKQTALMSQINLLAWVFAAAALLAVVLLVIGQA